MHQRHQAHRQRFSAAGLLLGGVLAAALLSACGGDPGGGNGDGDGGGADAPLPGQVSSSSEFIAYVKQVIARFTTEGEPLDVGQLDQPRSESDEPAAL
ncbi:hypothetical protein OOT46_22400 [Aquabacterium sp. A7-Y]|uniref:hypothetical protein n=1 Tax=Aquabacterium sp. A7-Y TaxID=1349605 RepID=UPI00223E5E56|nr:hypothetical protein [Aquabacterium sp. A7-Y]MCW7540579.1 hypothetical protein [Aquabacterium sp. A7-Y]